MHSAAAAARTAQRQRIRGGRCRTTRSRRPGRCARAQLAAPTARRAMDAKEQLPYAAPEWAEGMDAPAAKLRLGLFPTPVQRLNLGAFGAAEGLNVFIKRDDLSGMQLSGNKVRKLEVTIGGLQSNHCRATAVAARYCGLDAHLVLRTSQALVDDDPGLEGNLLVERLIGAAVHLCTKEEYGKHGSERLGQMVAEELSSMGKRPYVIPVGGSNALGSWGYVEMVRELQGQMREAGAGLPARFDDVVVACGSGGTVAGMALALDLSGMGSRLRAYGVCDSPKYFYDYCDGLLDGMRGTAAVKTARELFEAVDAKGSGYAISTEDELHFVHDVARETGIVFDPVYSGKALFKFVRDVEADPGAWAGKNVLFVHTGGLLGMYDKQAQLRPIVAEREDVFRMKL